MTDVTLSLVSHTNVGKTTLARTLLGREVGEVRDAPHVTDFADRHELIASPQGDHLWLWDTPGFGDCTRLVKRLRTGTRPWGWFLSEVWDRWRDRPFWATQQALRHVQTESDLVLYLVNAAESPAAAGYVASEMELLGWMGKPVLVLLNQLGEPRAPELEAADVAAWRAHLAPWPLVNAVLPLDAFARCWVHELTLLRAAQAALPGERGQAMARLAAAWQAQGEERFAAAMALLAASLASTMLARESVEDASGLAERLRRIGATLARRDDADPAVAAQARLAASAQQELRESTTALLRLHGLQGRAQDEILARVATQFDVHARVSEGRAAVMGGAITGALAGLKADLATGGLTLGGGLLVGGVLGALGAAGVARGINVVRGTGQSWVAWSEQALSAQMRTALLRYLAVAHFGRGRGEWAAGEAPAHWLQTVDAALAPLEAELLALWRRRGEAGEAEVARLSQALQPLLERATRDALTRLYPEPDNHAA